MRDFGMAEMITEGFGIAQVRRDGEKVYDHMDIDRAYYAEHGPEGNGEWPPYWTGQDAENAALADPDHKWEIIMEAPLSGGKWERTAPGIWTQTEDTRGFA